MQDAGTNATVSVTIFGERGDTGALTLDTTADNFVRASEDSFTVARARNVGAITHVVLGHDESALMGDPSWHVAELKIHNLKTGEAVTFPAGCWIGKEREPHFASQVALAPAGKEAVKMSAYRVAVRTTYRSCPMRSTVDASAAAGENACTARNASRTSSMPSTSAAGSSNATDDDTALASTPPLRYMRSTCFSTNGAEEHVWHLAFFFQLAGVSASSSPRLRASSRASSAADTGAPNTPWPTEHASTALSPMSVRASAPAIVDVACAVVIATTLPRAPRKWTRSGRRVRTRRW